MPQKRNLTAREAAVYLARLHVDLERKLLQNLRQAQVKKAA